MTPETSEIDKIACEILDCKPDEFQHFSDAYQAVAKLGAGVCLEKLTTLTRERDELKAAVEVKNRALNKMIGLASGMHSETGCVLPSCNAILDINEASKALSPTAGKSLLEKVARLETLLTNLGNAAACFYSDTATHIGSTTSMYPSRAMLLAELDKAQSALSEGGGK